MWLSLVSDPATANFSHTVSVIQQCFKDNHEMIADLTSLQSNLPEEMRTRLDGAPLIIEQAAVPVKMQAWTFSYRALMGSAPGSEDAWPLSINLRL
jgi:hypothetical protein